MYEPLIPPDLARLAARGEARAIVRGEPMSVEEILGRASAAMDEQDRAEEYRRDPIAFLTAHRPRRRLIDRLLNGSGRHGRN